MTNLSNQIGPRKVRRRLAILLPLLLILGSIGGALVTRVALAGDDPKPQRLRGSVDDLAARVGALEQQLQSLSSPKPAYHGNVIQAERFEVLNATGKVVGMFGSFDGLPIALALLDIEANPRILISVGHEGSAEMQFVDKKLQPQLRLGIVDAEGTTNSAKAIGLAIYTPMGQKTIDFTTVGPHSSLKFYDMKNAARVMVGVSDTLPIISTWDSTGKLLWFAPASE